MAVYIAAKKGFIVVTGLFKIHKEKEYSIFSYTNNIHHATRFPDYDAAMKYIVTASDILGGYTIFQKYHCGMTNRHQEMFFAANRYGFIYDTGKQRSYNNDGVSQNVIRTTVDSRLGTPFKTYQDLNSFISNSLFAEEPYAIVVPIFR